MRRLCSHQLGDENVLCRRLPKPRVRPCASTGRMSGWRSTSHFGGVAVGVHSTTRSPASPSTASARSSHPNSKRSGSGSICDQANSPMRT